MIRLAVKKLDDPCAFFRRCVLRGDCSLAPLPPKWRKKAGITGRQPQTIPEPTSASLDAVSDVYLGNVLRFLENTYDQSARCIIS